MFQLGDYIEIKLYGRWHQLHIIDDATVAMCNEIAADSVDMVRPYQCNEPGNTCARIKGYDEAQLWYFRNSHGL